MGSGEQWPSVGQQEREREREAPGRSPAAHSCMDCSAPKARQRGMRSAALLLFYNVHDVSALETGMASIDRVIAAAAHHWPLSLLLLGIVLALVLGRQTGGGRTATAYHILVKDEAHCNSLKAEIQEDQRRSAKIKAEGTQLDLGLEAFKAAAAQHSTCPSGKNAGGSLGTFGPGMMVPAFDKVCWSAPIGEVQGPVATQFGFHLILVTARTEPEKDKQA